MQMLPKPAPEIRPDDKFADSRPLLVVSADGSLSKDTCIQDGAYNGSIANNRDSGNGSVVPTIVRFYSLRSQSYVHLLKFRSAVYSVRCSSRIVAVGQAAQVCYFMHIFEHIMFSQSLRTYFYGLQIHCFGAAKLEREYTILTNPIVSGFPGSGGIGCGPLAVGPRWLAYSGSPVPGSDCGRVSPQHLTPSASFPGFSSNGSLVAHYAKESSKQLASGIVTLGDMGYKKLSRYLPDSYNYLQSGGPGWKGNGTVNGHLVDVDNVGMVCIIRPKFDSKLVFFSPSPFFSCLLHIWSHL